MLTQGSWDMVKGWEEKALSSSLCKWSGRAASLRLHKSVLLVGIKDKISVPCSDGKDHPFGQICNGTECNCKWYLISHWFLLVWWVRLKGMNCICLGEETQLNFPGSCFVFRYFLAILHLSLKKQLTCSLTSVSWSQMTPGLMWQRQQPREWTASNLSTSLTTSSRWVHPGLPTCHPPQPSEVGWLLYQSQASFARNCGHKVTVLRALIWDLKFMLYMTCSCCWQWDLLQGRELLSKCRCVMFVLLFSVLEDEWAGFLRSCCSWADPLFFSFFTEGSTSPYGVLLPARNWVLPSE